MTYMMYGVIYSSSEAPTLEKLQSAIAQAKYPCSLSDLVVTDDFIKFEGSLFGEPVALKCLHTARSEVDKEGVDIDHLPDKFDRCFGRSEYIPDNLGLYLYWSFIISAFDKVADALEFIEDFGSPSSLKHEERSRRDYHRQLLLQLHYYNEYIGILSTDASLASLSDSPWYSFLEWPLGEMHRNGFLKVKNEWIPVYEEGRCIIRKMYEITDQGIQQIETMLDGMKQAK
tara:strand:- start:46 stop:732 length:687 start_codon:yes stop_codon:yes gene_type:complete